jgi:hypothetical protein
VVDHDFPTLRFSERVFRFGNRIDIASYPDIDKLDSWQLKEFVEMFDRDKLLSLDGFLDAPFETVHPGGSRFTDGSFGVYYSALDRETARMEAHDFYRTVLLDGAKTRRIAYYRCISCQFRGDVIDLRASGGLYLVDSEGESECQKLARKARDGGADGLLTPSAARERRGEDGTCLPAFTRRALTSPAEEGEEKFVFDPSNNYV